MITVVPAMAEIEKSESEFAKPRRNRGNIRKRPTDEEEEGVARDSDAEETVLPKAKLQKATPLSFTTKQGSDKGAVKLLYESERGVQQATDQGATRTLETETETDRDARYLDISACYSVLGFPVKPGTSKLHLSGRLLRDNGKLRKRQYRFR